MNCPRCASAIDDSQARFCPFCGASTETPAAAVPGAPTAPAPAEPAVTPGQARCAVHTSSPAIDLCARCGAFTCRECIEVGLDGLPWCKACHAREGGDQWRVPWEQRSELGFFRAYWQTTRAVMFNPLKSFEGLSHSTNRWWDPLSYALLSGFLGMSGMMIVYALMFLVAGLTSSTGDATTGVAVSLGMIAVLAVVAPISIIMMVFVWGGLEHLMLMLVGVQTRGFEATVRANCYSHAPMLFGVIPMCGAYIYPIWQLVCRILAYRGVHRTTGGRSTAAVLLPIGVVCGLGVVVYAMIIAAAIGVGGFK